MGREGHVRTSHAVRHARTPHARTHKCTPHDARTHARKHVYAAERDEDGAHTVERLCTVSLRSHDRKPHSKPLMTGLGSLRSLHAQLCRLLTAERAAC